MLLHWHQTLANSAIVQVTANHKMAIEEVLEELVRWPFAGGEAGDRGRASTVVRVWTF